MNIWHGNQIELKKSLADRPIDVFICSASYEARCTSVSSSIDRSLVAKAVVAMNVTYRETIESQFQDLCFLFAGRYSPVYLDSDNPIRSADGIVEGVGGLFGAIPQHILIDITTLTRESLLMLIRFLNSRLTAGSTVGFAYACAKEYLVGDDPKNRVAVRGSARGAVRAGLSWRAIAIPEEPSHCSSRVRG